MSGPVVGAAGAPGVSGPEVRPTETGIVAPAAQGAATILLVEDGAADAHLVCIALAGLPGVGWLHVARTGEEALRFLSGGGAPRRTPPPDLVLLDLNLPGIDGWVVLARIRADRRLLDLPVIVLTSSANPIEAHRAYEAGANGYVTKPLDLEAYLSTLRSLVQYWLAILRRPDATGG